MDQEKLLKWAEILKKVEENKLDLAPIYQVCDRFTNDSDATILWNIFDNIVTQDPNFNSESQNTLDWSWRAFQMGFNLGQAVAASRNLTDNQP